MAYRSLTTNRSIIPFELVYYRWINQPALGEFADAPVIPRSADQTDGLTSEPPWSLDLVRYTADVATAEANTSAPLVTSRRRKA